MLDVLDEILNDSQVNWIQSLLIFQPDVSTLSCNLTNTMKDTKALDTEDSSFIWTSLIILTVRVLFVYHEIYFFHLFRPTAPSTTGFVIPSCKIGT